MNQGDFVAVVPVSWLRRDREALRGLSHPPSP
jgi:hypothetical protein